MSSFASDSRGRTPKKNKRRSKSQNQSFEGSDILDQQHNFETESEDPVVIVTVAAKSPVSPLQGSSRVIKDHCADWYNYIDKWNGLNDKGLAVVNKIVTARLQVQYSESPEEASMRDKDDIMEADSGEGIIGNKVPEGLEGMCADLGDVYKSMEKLTNKMASITKHLKGVCEMENSTPGSGGSQPMFLTWPVQFFWEASCSLEEMYTKELAVKKAIIEDVAHAKSRNILMTYTATWVHQPYIDDEATATVESMLKETGHR